MAGSRFSLVPEDVPKVDTKYRRIATMIPPPESVPVFEDLERFESVSMHGQLPVFWDRAEGFQVHDAWATNGSISRARYSSPMPVTAMKRYGTPYGPSISPSSHLHLRVAERVNYIKYLIDNTPDQFEKAFLLSAKRRQRNAASS